MQSGRFALIYIIIQISIANSCLTLYCRSCNIPCNFLVLKSGIGMEQTVLFSIMSSDLSVTVLVWKFVSI